MTPSALCRGRVAADDQDAGAHLLLSQSLMKRAQIGRPALTYTEHETKQLEEVVAEATKAIDLLRPTELKIQRHVSLVLRGCARAILQLSAEAMADFDEVLARASGFVRSNFLQSHASPGRWATGRSFYAGSIA